MFRSIKNAPEPEAQRERVKPSKIVSGGLPGSTEIRIGGDQNVKISGVDRTVAITTNSGSIIIGNAIDTGEVGLSLQDPDGKPLFQMGPDRWLWYDKESGDGRALFDIDGNGHFTFKISKTGKEVVGAANDDLVLNSDNNLFKIVKTGSFALPMIEAASESVVDFDTGVSSDKPLIANVYAERTTGYQPLPIVATRALIGANPASGGVQYSIYTYSYVGLEGNSTIHVHGINYDTERLSSIGMKYYLFQESAA